MSTSHRSRSPRFALAGRIMRWLPAPLLRAVMHRRADGKGAPMPPFHDLVAFLEAMGPAAERVMSRNDGIDLRTRFPELAAVSHRPLRIGPAEVPARVYRNPDVPARAALVWVHGGAYVSGSLDMHESDWVASALAGRGIPVLALDYRKALHGVRYPVPRDDVLAGWHWAVEHSEEALGVAPDALHLGGASAGGNLAASATRYLLEHGAPPPRSLALAYATLHGSVPAWEPAALAAVREATHGTCFEPDWLTDKNLHYAGKDHFDDPAAFPGEGEPLPGHPPTLLVNCENDTVRPSAERFAQQLAAAGVPCGEHLLSGASHGSLDRPTAPDGQEALALIEGWITAHS
ncbi:alpha/beta hydrolase [Streptomyces griseiscabiei]|uniref:Alpha/beta hydrolase n=2 Tax=Streptomyces griseiscabiei TaxID=2993540 RepID=A0ABU4L6I8_9ACTN|nr:alpha/beta hydrolase [Streptomyces griseiscabiei]MBZ3906327.1 alpha/beta hydrolase [Streptomyces griseiscabiei]MDX2911324.1 alpha/beta hydrolase [Streptomyces griseiscabiei]